MAMFEHHPIQEDQDRQHDYKFSEVQPMCTLYWHYWLAWPTLFKPVQRNSSPSCRHFTVLKCLSAVYQQLRSILPYMAVLLSSHYGKIAGTVMDLYSCVSESDR